jgi:5-methylcytosine-specific restriction endonuclease McrA
MKTILSGWPVPAIFLYCQKSKNHVTYQVIDGKQRIESVLLFMGRIRGDAFSVDFSADDSKPQKTDWKRLNKLQEANRVRAYEFNVVEVEGDLSSIFELFVRINSTGKPLSAAERRHALYHSSPTLAEAHRLAKRLRPFLSESQIVTDAQALRMKDTELMCELIASAHSKGPLDKKDSLNAVMGTGGASERDAKRAAAQVERAFRYIRKHFKDIRATRFHRRSDIYSLVLLLMTLRRDGCILDDSQRAAQAWQVLRRLSVGVDELGSSETNAGASESEQVCQQYLMTVKEGTDARSKRETREKILRTLIASIFEEKDKQRLFTDAQRRLLWNNSRSTDCEICKQPIVSWADFEADHRTPHSKGGKTKLTNGALTHRGCNRKKSNRTPRRRAG